MSSRRRRAGDASRTADTRWGSITACISMAVMTAFAVTGCPAQNWEFDLLDGSAGGSSTVSTAQIMDASPDGSKRDASTSLGGGPLDGGCPPLVTTTMFSSFQSPLNECIPCKDDRACPDPQVCDTSTVPGRCVQCKEDFNCDSNEICVLEHCVTFCTGFTDCNEPGTPRQDGFPCLPLDAGADAGRRYCLECTPTMLCGGGFQCTQQNPATAGICVECLNDSQCNGGSCGANGYCNGQPP